MAAATSLLVSVAAELVPDFTPLTGDSGSTLCSPTGPGHGGPSVEIHAGRASVTAARVASCPSTTCVVVHPGVEVVECAKSVPCE